MKDTKREAYEEAARLFFEAAERLREALDEADLSGLELAEAAADYLNEAQTAIERQGQNYQRGAKGGLVRANAISAAEKPTAKTIILKNGEAATFEPMGEYTAENGRHIKTFAAALNLWEGDLETLRRLAERLPDIDGRRPTIAEAYHAAATYGIHHLADISGIKPKNGKAEA